MTAADVMLPIDAHELAPLLTDVTPAIEQIKGLLPRLTDEGIDLLLDYARAGKSAFWHLEVACQEELARRAVDRGGGAMAAYQSIANEYGGSPKTIEGNVRLQRIFGPHFEELAVLDDKSYFDEAMGIHGAPENKLAIARRDAERWMLAAEALPTTIEFMYRTLPQLDVCSRVARPGEVRAD